MIVRARDRTLAVVVACMLVSAAIGVPCSDAVDRLAQGWDDLSPAERGEALRNYQRFKGMPPERQRAVEQNYDRWRQLPPQEKDRLRGNYEQYRRMSPDERQDFQRRYRDWKHGK